MWEGGETKREWWGKKGRDDERGRKERRREEKKREEKRSIGGFHSPESNLQINYRDYSPNEGSFVSLLLNRNHSNRR